MQSTPNQIGRGAVTEIFRIGRGADRTITADHGHAIGGAGSEKGQGEHATSVRSSILREGPVPLASIAAHPIAAVPVDRRIYASDTAGNIAFSWVPGRHAPALNIALLEGGILMGRRRLLALLLAVSLLP